MCTAFRVLANPLLYRRINIRLWSRQEVERLQECNLAGAGLHFQHTKDLIIEDAPIGEEPHSIHTGRIRPPFLDCGPDALYSTLSQKDDSAYSLLQIMHQDNLERLW
jgi:hypothetical protein